MLIFFFFKRIKIQTALFLIKQELRVYRYYMYRREEVGNLHCPKNNQNLHINTDHIVHYINVNKDCISSNRDRLGLLAKIQIM